MTDQDQTMEDSELPVTNGKLSNRNGAVFTIELPNNKTTENRIPDPDREQYEPYSNRSVKHATSYGETLFHMMKASLGTGILSIPHAFKNSGYLVGVIGTVIIGLFSCYCIHMMVVAQHILCRKKKIPRLTYPEIAETALSEGPESVRWMAPYGRVVSFGFLIMCELGASCVYVIFVAGNLKAVVDRYYGEQDIRYYMIMVFFPILLLCWIRNLKLLAPFSTVACVVTIASFGITLYYVFTDIPNLSDRNPGGNLKELPLFFGTVMFSMSAIGIIMPLENEMKNPARFTSRLGVLNVAMIFLAAIYTGFGFFGYLKYGPDTAGSITLNLPQDDLLAQTVKLMLGLAIACTIALPQYIIYDIIWNCHVKSLLEKNSFALVYAYVLKTAVCVLTFGLAILIPNLELFISLIGSLCLPFMAIALPALTDLITFWDTKHGIHRTLFIAKHVVIFLIAVIGCYTGVKASVREILREVFHVEL
uniref:Proton-coupled amino acid transporter 4 n=1 Tax=Cacopsylla melanoneura TaxID=428564 RepID=A0A8D8ZIN1_9HEMI